MQLTGWKEIAAYLKHNVSTAQRWHRESHLPVIRPRRIRSQVIADSAKLDEWLQRRSSITGLRERTSSLLETSARTGRDFAWTELSTGREFARLASRSPNSRAQVRRTKAARAAYDTVRRILDRHVALPEQDLKRIRTDLKEFKRELEKLGEKF